MSDRKSKYQIFYYPRSTKDFDKDEDSAIVVAHSRKEAKKVFWDDEEHKGAMITRVKWRNDLEPVFESHIERSQRGDLRKRIRGEVGRVDDGNRQS